MDNCGVCFQHTVISSYWIHYTVNKRPTDTQTVCTAPFISFKICSSCSLQWSLHLSCNAAASYGRIVQVALKALTVFHGVSTHLIPFHTFPMPLTEIKVFWIVSLPATSQFKSNLNSALQSSLFYNIHRIRSHVFHNSRVLLSIDSLPTPELCCQSVQTWGQGNTSILNS